MNEVIRTKDSVIIVGFPTKEHIADRVHNEQTNNKYDESFFGKNDVIPLGYSTMSGKEMLKHIPIRHPVKEWINSIIEKIRLKCSENILTKPDFIK